MLKSVMCILTRTLLLVTAALLSTGETVANDTLRVLFRVGEWRLDTTMLCNSESLAEATRLIRESTKDESGGVKRTLVIVGSASPEGTEKHNSSLARRRAEVVKQYLLQATGVADSLIRTESEPNHWQRLRRMVSDRDNIYNHDRMTAIIDTLADSSIDAAARTGALQHLQELDGGLQMRYIVQELYPLLRSAEVLTVNTAPAQEQGTAESAEGIPDDELPATGVEATATDSINAVLADSMAATNQTGKQCKPFYMSLRTNMLYDAALVPNIGADFYIGRNWSIAAMWTYAWWSIEASHRFLRTYGGDITLRRWVGRASKRKPLTGHHIGVYAQASTFDFELGGTGYMGGKPGGSMWDKINWSAGVEYGFSLPVARRLNIDFTIAVGYTDCEYHTYSPEDGCYVLQSTKHLRTVLPAKVEVSLVWLIGRGNRNRQKGGTQ